MLLVVWVLYSTHKYSGTLISTWDGKYTCIVSAKCINSHVLCKNSNGERASPANLKSSLGSKLICLVVIKWIS